MTVRASQPVQSFLRGVLDSLKHSWRANIRWHFVPSIDEEGLDLLMEHLTKFKSRVGRVNRWLHVVDVHVAHLLCKC